jgi:MFS-type transporter involved in bile tolerance (Atg22 family)
MDDFGSSLRFALRAVTDLTGTILVPAFVAALLGKSLDARYGTGHIVFAALLALTFVGTAIILVKKVRQYAKEYQQLIAR